MKKQLSTLALSLSMMSSVIGFSQNEKKIIPCYTTESMEQKFAEHPEEVKNYEAKQAQFQEQYLINRNNRGKAAATVYTVPVVFHILHTGGAENISDQAVINALSWVNGDYARTHSDASLTAAPFSSLYINSDIKMMLAHKDPSGNCTSGIVHHWDAKTQWSQSAANNPAYWSYTWDPTKYLNIYIVASIASQGTVTGGGIIVGYTYRPGTPGVGTGSLNDAIVYRYDFLSGSDARSLSHEMGHWFNLAHTWGNTNAPGVQCGDDGITDTPPTKGQAFNCPSSLSGNTCAGSGGLDNVQNIMNYASCPINFTADQTTAMRTCLTSGTNGRSNIISPGNLTATDVNGTVPCAPICDWFSSTNNYTICSGGSLTMKDASYNGTVTSYAWAATGGPTIAAPTASQTAMTFTTIGTSVVTLTVTNGQGSSTLSRTVTVLDGTAGAPGIYFESFEAVGTPSNWVVVNPNGGSVAWAQTSLASSHGNSSFYIEGLSNSPNHIDYLQMPVLDFLNNPNDSIFTFKYAYARASASNNDAFEVQASANCGGTWSTLMSLSASAMANGSGGVTAAPYIPAPNEWKTVNIYGLPQFGPFASYKSVLIRFKFQEDAAGFGNRFYLDEINLTSVPVGLNELGKSIRFSLAPNPSNGEAVVKFDLNESANVKIDVVDIVGKKVLPSTDGNYGVGEQSITINKNNTLSKGIYFVNLSFNGAKMSKKLIIQ